MIRISVIIPNYNHAAYLAQRIESVLAQTYPPSEIILLDDASTDESRNVLEQYRAHPLVSHILVNEKNSGSPFLQWQKGVALARYEWVWIAESDDHCQPSFLATAVAMITANPDTGLFYCDSLKNPGNDRFAAEKNSFFNTTKWSQPYSISGIEETENFLGVRCTVNNASAALMRTDLLRQCITELSGYRFHGDWFCYLYIASKSAITYSPEPMNTCRVHTSGISTQLPEDGRDQPECFRILSFITTRMGIQSHRLVERFTLLHLRSGLWSGRKLRKAWQGIDKKLARSVFFILLKNRFSFTSKKKA